MPKSLRLASLGLLAVLAQSAVAVTVFDLSGSLNPSQANQAVNFSDPAPGGSFDDVFNFSFSSLPMGANTGAASGVQLQISSASPNVDFSSVSLNGVAGTVDNTLGNGLVSVFFVGPVAGESGNNPAYSLEVLGTATAGATFGGSLNVSVVSEPATRAAWLAGLGVLGLKLRRLRRESLLSH